MEQWIRKRLEIHDIMSVDNLCLVFGCSKEEIHSALEMMIQRGEVERLRPVNYESDDMDFYRLLCRPARAAARGVNGGGWFVRIKQVVNLFLEDKEDTSDYKHANNILTTS